MLCLLHSPCPHSSAPLPLTRDLRFTLFSSLSLSANAESSLHFVPLRAPCPMLSKTVVIKTFLLIVILLFSFSAYAQAPEGFNYSAIVRDNTGDPLTNQSVSFRFSIIRGNVAGTVVYSETHNTTTNQLGQVSLIIGNGSMLSGVFANIPWGVDAYFLKVELDRDGGSSYVEMGISQFLSVPYALYAKTAGSGGSSGTGEINISAGSGIILSGTGTDSDPYTISEKTHFVGEYYGGGIVFYTYDYGKHGLIASLADQDRSIQWHNGVERYTNTTGNGIGKGEMNTALIIARQTNDNPVGTFASKLSADYSITVNGLNYGDWYLPSRLELTYLFLRKDVVGGFANTVYWSSTEFSSVSAWGMNMAEGSFFNIRKNTPCAVRAIRAF